jgi:nickel transport protein
LATCASAGSGPVQAHAVSHRIDQAETIMVSLESAPGQPLSGARYRVFGPDPGPPFSVGRTNSRGELAFRPDRPGTWRVIVSSADGHGASVRIDVDEALRAGSGAATAGSRWPMLLAGLGYIIGLAGLAAMWKRGR